MAVANAMAKVDGGGGRAVVVVCDRRVVMVASKAEIRDCRERIRSWAEDMVSWGYGFGEVEEGVGSLWARREFWGSVCLWEIAE